MPGTPDHVALAASADVYRAIAAASTNAAVVKASGGILVGYYITNKALAFRYVKLYNKASAPTVGTDTPKLTLGIPPQSAANVSLPRPVAFGTGIGVAITTGIGDADTGAVAAEDLAVNLYYI